MKKPATRWLPTCSEVHHLVSEGLDRNLSPLERARMRFHFLICAACRTFDGQMTLLRRAMRTLPTVDTSGDDNNNRIEP
ncbi:MAG: zf-HC2 domain-containing protein [Oxalobacteraceae bacterium]|nr:zf-HC2 domain-containing protein [Oxalobacteraceae bacterium]